LTEISKRLGWPKSTVHGILSTLRDYRYVDQSPHNGRYKLGIRLFELGLKVARSWDVRQIALPIMQRINKQYGEMVQLATEDDGEVFYIEKIDSTHIIRIVSEIGARLPIHCSGLGKAILAHQSATEVKRIIEERGLDMVTKHTITDPEKLDIELAKIRIQGYAVDDQEIMEGLRCVAAPIRDASGEVRYAISISGLSDRLVGPYFDQIKEEIVKASVEISRQMGYRV
jgi:DNA-binding IclR family transcriptional regulator